jgi:hypothetical protein
MKYTVFAALHEDTNAGWVWIGTKHGSHRPTIRLKNTTNGKSVFCEALHIEDNFKSRYNSQRTTLPISVVATSIVMNEWYRQRLGIGETQQSIDFDVRSANNWIGRFRANIAHPQVLVRQAMWLALLSVLLGGLSLGLALLPHVGSFCVR